MSDLPQKVRSAFAWTVLGEIGVSGIRFLSYLVYATFMTPEDYGIVGFAAIFVQFITVLTEQAMPMAVIQGPEEEADERASVIIAGNLLLASFGYLAIWLVRIPAAHWLADPRIEIVLPVLGVRVFFSALSSTHVALARRRLEGRKLFYVRVFTTVASLAVSAPLAFDGYAYWALVASMVAGSAGQTVAAWMFIRWRRSWISDWKKLRDMAEFIGWTAMDLIMTWALMTGGSFFLGTLLGEQPLGKFRLTEQLLSGIFGIMLEPLAPMVYSALAAAFRENQDMKVALVRLNAVFCIIAIPMSGLFFVVSSPLEGLLGHAWRGTAVILSINALSYGVGYLGYAVSPYLRAVGRPAAGAVIRATLVVLQLPVFYFSARQGITAFLWAKVGIEAASLLAGDIALRRISEIKMADLLRPHWLILLGSGAAAGITLSVEHWIKVSSNFLALGVVLILYLFQILIMFSRIESSVVAQFLQILRKRLRPG